VVQRVLGPFDEPVPLVVAPEVDGEVQIHGVGATVVFGDHRVVHCQVDRDGRLQRRGITTEFGQCIAHSREVGECRQTRGVVQHDSVRMQRYLARRDVAAQPCENRRQ
jgi:hypothetical protein